MLQAIAKKILTGHKLSCLHAEVVEQTILACAKNETEHNDAFSWLHSTKTAGAADCGTNNGKGLDQLISEGYITKETYQGTLSPLNPDEIVLDGDKFVVLRVTDKLLDHIK